MVSKVKLELWEPAFSCFSSPEMLVSAPSGQILASDSDSARRISTKRQVLSFWALGRPAGRDVLKGGFRAREPHRRIPRQPLFLGTQILSPGDALGAEFLLFRFCVVFVD